MKGSRNQGAAIDITDILPRLQELEYRGRDLLLDPLTSAMYEWPQSCVKDQHGDEDDGVPNSKSSSKDQEANRNGKWARQHAMPSRIGHLNEEGELRLTETWDPMVRRLAELFNSMYLHMKVRAWGSSGPNWMVRPRDPCISCGRLCPTPG